MDDLKFALLSKLIFFFKAPLPLPVISFDSCGGNVSTIFQIFYFVTSKDQKSKKQISSSKRRHLGCDNSRWRPDSWIWWAAALMMKRVPNLQYSWHLGKGKILIFWYFHRYRGTVIILSPSLSWQVPIPFCQSKPFDTVCRNSPILAKDELP